MIGITTNILNLQNARNMARNRDSIRTSMERIASGSLERNGGNRFSSRISELSSTRRGVSLTNSLLNGIEESSSTTSNLLLRARELTVRASNDTLTDDARSSIYNEISEIFSEIDRISGGANFSAIPFLSDSESVYVQTGPNSYDRVGITFEDLSVESLGLESFNYLLQSNYETGAFLGSAVTTSLINVIDNASSIVNNYRASLGSIQLDRREESLAINEQNLREASSRIYDTDIAQESILLMQELAIRDALSYLFASANLNQASVLRLLTVS